MPRAVPASYLAEAQKGNTNFVYFVRFATPADVTILAVCSADMDLDVLGETYTGLGAENIAYDRITESGTKRKQGVTLSFAAVDTSLVVTPLQATRHRGGIVQIYAAHYDPSTGTPVGAPVDDPLMLFSGHSQTGFEVSESYPDDPTNPGSALIECRVASVFAELEQVRGLRTNMNVHQRWYPGDTGFQNVQKIEGQQIFWGRAGPVDRGIF